MNRALLLILIHQLVFQGLFIAKNLYLQKRIALPIRGSNREAIVSTLFFALFILTALALAAMDTPVGTFALIDTFAAFLIASALLLLNLLIGAASLHTMQDSWRVGVLESQTTVLVTEGIFRYSRNPYFASYLLMFIAYSILLQNFILLLLTFLAAGLIHWMVKREEQYLAHVHKESYLHYKVRTPRYFIV